MNVKKILALLLAMAMVFAFVACGQPDEPEVSDSTAGNSEDVGQNETPDPDVDVSGTDDPEVTETEDEQPGKVNLAVLSGPTGIGAAKLLSDADAGTALNDYEYIIAADNQEVMAGLINGDVDIAAVASNVALNLYNKTNGGVKILALGTEGVLHLLEGGGGQNITSLEDLMGETIWSAGQGANPEYILRYLLTQSGIDPDSDVELVFADASEITAKLLSGEIRYAMLPVPAATAAIIKGEGKVRAAVDMTEAWQELAAGSRLIMTAVVARTEFIEENPEAVKAFLQEYEASIKYVNENVDEAAELIAGYGITPSAAIAKKAIPQCNLIYIDGADMVSAISDYYMVLYSVDPASVGGGLPDDGIYYVP